MNFPPPFPINSTQPSMKRKANAKWQNVNIDPNVIQKLYLAQAKLMPVIDEVVKTPEGNNVENSHFLTVKQYEDALWVAQTLKEVSETLRFVDSRRLINPSQINLEKKYLKFNKAGQIYVDTAMLIQLMDLYSMLDEMIDQIKKEQGINTCVQTDLDGSVSTDSESDNSNKILVKLKSKPMNLPLPFIDPGLRNFLVMPSKVKVGGRSSKKQLKPKLSKTESKASKISTRSTKSTSSMGDSEDLPRVTDVDGARRIISRCLDDLQKVKSYLENKKLDVAISAEVEVQNVAQQSTESSKVKNEVKPKKSKSLTKKNSNAQVVSNPSQGKVCPCDTCPSGIQDREGNPSRVVICIKGRDECEGDIKIIIKQCPDCKQAEVDEQKKRQPEKTKSNTSYSSKPTDLDAQNFSSLQNIPYENKILHNKDSKGSIICSTSTDEISSSKINVIFNPNDPANSIVEPFKTLDVPPSIIEEDVGDFRRDIAEESRSNGILEEPRRTTILEEPPRTSVLEEPRRNSFQEDSRRNTMLEEPRRNTVIEEPWRNAILDEPRRNSVLEEPRWNTVLEETPRNNVQEEPRRNIILEEPRSNMEQSILPNEGGIYLDSNINQRISSTNCTRIKANETTNLCFITDGGEEYIITLTIRPISDKPVATISLRDIFSESNPDVKAEETPAIPLPIMAESSEMQTDASQQELYEVQQPEQYDNQPASYGVESKTTSMQDVRDASMFPRNTEERIDFIPVARTMKSVGIQDCVIPLPRTKICSSMEFDVSVVHTKLRSTGVRHANPQIVLRLTDFGVDNLLRASRPAKCCRRSILNEKLKKCLPYPPSLRSLPLGDSDINIIQQSLDMSVQKVKNSNQLQNNLDTLALYTTSGDYTQLASSCRCKCICREQIYYFASYPRVTGVPIMCEQSVRNILSFYINLVHDVCEACPKLVYQVMHFGTGEPAKVVKRPPRKGMNVGSSSGHKETNSNVEALNNPCLAGSVCNATPSTCTQDISNSNIAKTTKNATSRVIFNASGVSSCVKEVKCRSKIPIYGKKKLAKQKAQMCPEDSATNLPKLIVYPTDSRLIENVQGGSVSKHMIIESGKNTPVISSTKTVHRTESKKRICDILYKNCAPSAQSISILKSSTMSLKIRKKKPQYYLSRSRSDVSIDTVAHLKSSDEKENWGVLNGKVVLKESTSSSLTIKHQSNSVQPSGVDVASNVILDYFKSALYDMIVKDLDCNDLVLSAIKEKVQAKVCDMAVSTSKGFCGVQGLSTVRCQYKVSSNVLSEKNLSKLCKTTGDAKMSVLSSTSLFNFLNKSLPASDKKLQTSRSNLNASLALQTSKVWFGIDKTCQAFCAEDVVGRNDSLNPCKDFYMTRQIFESRLTDEYALLGTKASCDNFGKFIVLFKSETSIPRSRGTLCNVSSCGTAGDFISTTVITSSITTVRQVFGENENSNTEVSLCNMQKHVDYFVYENFEKTPTLFQKFLDKSRGIFKSNCTKDCDLKLKFRNMNSKLAQPSKSGMHHICKKCGCYIANCATHGSSKMTKFCSCPKENKSPNNKSKSEREKTLKDRSNKCLNANSIQTLKKSLCKFIKSTGFDKTGPSTCTNLKSSGTLCKPSRCLKKRKKCFCKKCEVFAADGSCLCSHCTASNEKGVDVYKSTRNVGILCKCSGKNTSSRSNNEDINRVDKQSGLFVDIDSKLRSIEDNANTLDSDAVDDYVTAQLIPPDKELDTEIEEMITAVPRNSLIISSSLEKLHSKQKSVAEVEEPGDEIQLNHYTFESFADILKDSKNTSSPVASSSSVRKTNSKHVVVANAKDISMNDNVTYSLTLSQPFMFSEFNNATPKLLQQSVWALTRVNMYQDGSRDYQIIDLRESPETSFLGESIFNRKDF